MSAFVDRIQSPDSAAHIEASKQTAAVDDRALLESVSPRTVCFVRFILALAALVVIYMDPFEPDRFVEITYGALLLYTAYSGLLYLAAARTGNDIFSPVTMWADVGSFLVLIALSGGTGSIFFFFFFFSILVASFRGGYQAGLRVTFVSSILFTFVGYAATTAQGFMLNLLLLRPIYLIVLGYMISVWGGSELKLKRRLALLKSISRSANPRFGVDQTLCSFMESVRRFYGADTCLLVTQHPDSANYFLRRSDRYRADRAVRAERVSREIGFQLISLLGEEAVSVVVSASRAARPGWRLTFAGNTEANADDPRWQSVVASLKKLIGDESFLSVPWPQRDGTAARLYITSRAHVFARGDLEFLCQVVEHVRPVIENIQLLDQLASAAAERERRRISRDLHDTTLQPYIGLKLGIESVRRKAAPDNPLAGDLNALVMRAELGLSDLRRYIDSLKREERETAEPVLSVAVQQYAERFTRLYRVGVSCEAQPDIAVSDRLAAEALQIVREGLSNVHRHTPARRAEVRLFQRAGLLVIEIENEVASARLPVAPFAPRSIMERAEALGGRAQVVEGTGGATVVCAEIPL